jgi:predicted nucleic acid-binding protein
MKPVFADAAFYIALAGEGDQFHEAARTFSDSYSGQIITSEFVLVEVGNLLSRRDDRRLFGALIADINADEQTRVIASSHYWFTRGLALFQNRSDKEWSLTDCISIEIMSRRKIQTVLTTDHHFEQAGFEVLLR